MGGATGGWGQSPGAALGPRESRAAAPPSDDDGLLPSAADLFVARHPSQARRSAVVVQAVSRPLWQPGTVSEEGQLAGHEGLVPNRWP